jgi:hypothetical protein
MMASEIETPRLSRRRIQQWTVSFLAISLLAQQVACSDGRPARSVAAESRAVDPEKEILIRDLSVLEDPVRSLDPCDVGSNPLPPWSFGKLMQNVANQAAAADASMFVQKWLDTWRQEQEVNGHLLEPVPIDQLVTDPWLQRSGGQRLDLTIAPFRLVAIVNRIDLAEQDRKGEFRMEYVATNVFCQPIRFWVILEFELPVECQDGLVALAQRWHALGDIEEFGEQYNAALQQLTDELSRARLKHVNSLEVEASVLEWNYRSFAIVDGSLVNVPLVQSPDVLDDGKPDLISWVNANQDAILADEHVVPEALLGGDTRNVDWTGAGFQDPIEVRHHFALATCNGCHGGETATFFVQMSRRHRGEDTFLSDYLTGETIRDPGGVWRDFNELQRRADYLQGLLTQP